jgi:hypothetical protein
MLTAVEAEKEISTATGTLPARVYRTARALREAGKDLYLMGKRGGGVSANQPGLNHLVNLMIALVVADPKSAVGLVSGFRKMVRLQSLNDAATAQQFPGGLLPASGSLSDALEGLVDALAHDTDGTLARALTKCHMELEFLIDPNLPRVTVAWLGEKKTAKRTVPTMVVIGYTPPREGDAGEWLRHPGWRFMASSDAKCRIVRKALIDVPLLCLFASIWARASPHKNGFASSVIKPASVAAKQPALAAEQVRKRAKKARPSPA